MARWGFPGWVNLARALTRMAAWITDIIAIVVLCFVAQRFTDTAGAVAPGIVGAAISLLNDSWQMAAFLHPNFGFPPIVVGRALMHDVFGFAVTLGGLVLLLLADVPGTKANNSQGVGARSTLTFDGLDYSRSRMTTVALAVLGSILGWRIVLVLWAVHDMYAEYRRTGQRPGQQRQELRWLNV